MLRLEEQSPPSFPKFAPAAATDHETRSFPLFPPKPFPQSLSAASNTLRPSHNFQPRARQEPGARLQHKHLHFVEFPFLSNEWWPCLAFPNFETMMQVYDDVFPSNIDVRSKLALEFLIMAANKSQESLEGLDVLLVLGKPTESKSYYNLRNAKRVCFEDLEFMQLLTSQMLKSKDNAALKEALNQTMELLKRMSQIPASLPERTNAPSPARKAATTTASSESKSPSGAATVVSYESGRKLANKGQAETDPSVAPSTNKEEQVATANKDCTERSDNEDFEVPMDCEEEPESTVPCMPAKKVRGRSKGKPKGRPKGKPKGRPKGRPIGRPKGKPKGSKGTGVAMENEDSGVLANSEEPESMLKHKLGEPGRGAAAKRAKKTPTAPTAPKPLYQETGDVLSIPTFAEVKRLFEQHEYVFDDKLYCRPFGDPRKYANVNEHVDYFTSEDSFRAHLCAHNVEYIGAPWEDEDENKIESWVRASVIKSFSKDGGIPELEMGKKDALKTFLTAKLGFKWKQGMCGYGYALPGASKKDKVYEEYELWDYLARHGLPETCKFENINKMERLALEQLIARGVALDPFFIMREEHGNTLLEHSVSSHGTEQEIDSPLRNDMETSSSPEPQQAAGEIPSQLRDRLEDCDGNSAGSSMQISPAVDKQALEASNRAPEDGSRSPVTNLDFGSEPLTQPQPNSSDDDSSDEDDMLQNGFSDPSNEAKEEPRNQHIEAESCDVPTQEVPNGDELEETGQSTIDSIPEVVLPGKTVDEKLQSCTEAMRKGIDDEMIVTGKLSSTLSQISSFVKAVIQSKGKTGSRGLPPYLHVCGAPGSGKTMGVKRCCTEAKEWAKKTLEDWVEEPKVCYVNASHLQNFSKKQALEKTLEYIGITRNRLKRPANADESTRSAIILILDEIDLLVAAKGSAQSSSGTEEYLRTLLSWASDENMLLSLIGISNSVENYKARRLNGLGLTKGKVVFNTYGKDDLIKIVESLIGRSVVDAKMIEFIASKVAATSGDARKFMDLISRSVQACRSKLPQITLDSELERPVVKLPHAMMVIRETNTKYKDLVESLPSLEKCTLCVGANLSRVLGSKPLTLGLLKKYSMECFGFDPMLDSCITLEDFKGIIERLVDSGLLRMVECDSKDFSTEPMVNLLQFPVRFDLQLEDVESALEETLLKEDFYKRIVARVKSLNVDSS